MTSDALTVCADDFGISSGTSEVILDLLGDGAINATTCLVETADWQLMARPLRGLADERRNITVGLHLNLTEQFANCAVPGIVKPVSRWIPKAALPESRHDSELIYKTLLKQWMLFVDGFGRNPDFIDGHQHVQLFGPIRKAMWRLVYEMRFKGWIRQCRTSSNRIIFHRVVLDPLSAILAREARRENVPVNRGFGGLRKFGRSEDLEKLWYCDLKAMRAGGLLVVHPGAAGSPPGSEGIDACRADEADLLRGGLLRRILSKRDVGLGADLIPI
jgi:predicted glycoside hydrolase/deacetylase ChbG (UPF0249 family)